MTGILRLVTIAITLVAMALFDGASSAWARGSRTSALMRLLVGLVLLLLGALGGAITIGVDGYRSLTAEQLAATIKTEPIGPHHFRATVTLADSSQHMMWSDRLRLDRGGQLLGGQGAISV